MTQEELMQALKDITVVVCVLCFCIVAAYAWENWL